MGIPVLLGLFAAMVVFASRVLREAWGSYLWDAPKFLLLVTGSAALFSWFWNRSRPGNRPYDGLADLFVHVHDPANPESSRRWGGRGLYSLALSFFGGVTGPEGGAAEFSKALLLRNLPRASRWIESRRRTDSAMALAAAVAAAFEAPLAGIILGIEIGLGGKALRSGVAALSAFVGVRLLQRLSPWPWMGLGLGSLDAEAGAWHMNLLWTFPAVVVGAAATAAFLQWMSLQGKRAVRGLTRRSLAWGVLLSGILLFTVAWGWEGGLGARQELFGELLNSGGDGAAHYPIRLAVSQLLMLVAVLAGAGTLGVFWPLFLLGASVGASLPGADGVAVPVLVFSGAAAILGATLNVPWFAAVLAMELSGSPAMVVPCALAALGAQWMMKKGFRMPGMVSRDLEERGLPIWDGRSQEMLERLRVSDALVTDFDTVEEHEPVSALHNRILKSRYPFIPVVDRQSRFVGLLTLDLIEEAWGATGTTTTGSPLQELLVARDLVFRGRVKAPTIEAQEPLTRVTRWFDDHPCVTVVDSSRRVIGLLFVHTVRLAYDREMGRAARLAARFSEATAGEAETRP